jgi:putative heme-binding domain-containing protein
MRFHSVHSRFLAVVLFFVSFVPLRAETPLPTAPDGFKVELLLAAPEIEAPTALAVAPNGDVYFAEDPMDMSGPPTKNLDRIWLLKGGDPKKKVLFAEEMWAVMGLEVVRDRLYCVHAPHVTVFTLAPDGTAAKREELFDDLGPKVAGLPGFNDHIPSGIRMGLDGWLYVSIGDKGIPRMSRIPIPLRGTERGKEIAKQGSVHVAEGRWRHVKEGHHISLEGGGVIRFRPDGTHLEVFASGTRNHLDVPMDEHDRIFLRDNTDDGLGWNTRFMYAPRGGYLGYPWAYKQRSAEALPMIHDFGGGSPCGGWVYCDDGLPETYRGRVFHCEWGKGKVFAVKVKPKGAGFELVDEIKFLDPEGTAVKEFRPFTLRPTTDGRGFYVTDWGYSGWLTRIKAGRIWKVTYTRDDVKPAPRGQDSDDLEQLVRALDHPAHTERLRAQRELIARGAKATAPLEKLIAEKKLTPRQLRHVWWVLTEAGPTPRFFNLLSENGLKDADAGVRCEALRCLGQIPTRETGIPEAQIGLLRNLLHDILKDDPDPQVRMQAADCLGSALLAGAEVSGRLYLRLLSEQDRYVVGALVFAIRNAAHWRFDRAIDLRDVPDVYFWVLADQYNLDALGMLKGEMTQNASFRIRAVEALARNYFDRQLFDGGWWGTQPAARKPPARTVAWEGTPVVREALLKALGDSDARVRKAVIAGLLAVRDPATLEPLLARFDAEADTAMRTDLVRVIAGLNVPKSAAFLSTLLADGKAPEALRLECIIGLEKTNTPGAIDGLAKVLDPREPIALQVRALEALGVLKAKQAGTLAKTALASPAAAVRQAAAGLLGKLGEATAAEALLRLLDDKETPVQIAAIQALGALKAKDALPALLQAAGRETTQFDAIKALAQVPDARALSAYLTGLGSKSPELRQACTQALGAIREKIVPALEQLVKRNEVRAELLPDLRGIYQSFAPVLSWHLIGPFPSDGKSHPPEKEQKFDAVYQGEGKQVRWLLDRKADVKQHGRVRLDALFSPTTNVVAYGYTEVISESDRDAAFLLGSDDTLTVWLNGAKVFEFTGNRGWAHDQDRVNVKLKKGKNTLLIQCGNASGPWEFSVAVSGDASKYAFLQGGQKFDLEAFRAFARKTAGDPERGRKLFLDLKGLACVKCHAVGGEGGNVGPALDGIALKYKREDLMTSILEPSKNIANGYETIVVTTRKGQTISGVFKGETGEALSLADAEGKLHVIPKKEIDERITSPISTMPNGLNEGMTLQDFADVIAYLEARKEEKIPPKK